MRAAATADALAIVLFATVGLLSHRGTVSAAGYAEDALPLLACWFAAALATRVYTSPSRARYLATWAAGVTGGVVVRALVLGHRVEPAFLVVALVFVLAASLALRALTRAASRTARRRRTAR